jgi:predicted  nucleic acid-binding Zn-ribbon protein
MVASVHAHASSSESVTASSTVTTGESDQAALRAIAQRLHTVLLRQREHEATEHEQSSRVKTETELLLDDARLQCSRVQAHAEDLQSRLALEQTDRAEWCAKAEQAQLRIALLERELEQEKQSCVELEEQLSEASVERGTLEAQIEALQTQLSDQGRRLNSAQQSSNAAAREVVATREMAAREQGAMQAQIDELTEQVNTTAAELTRVKADLKRTAVELKTSEQRLEKEVARARAAALSEQKEKLDAQHTDVIQTIRTSMSVKHEETESEMAVVEQKLAQSEYLVSDLQRTCANLQQTDAHLRAQIRKLQETDRIPELEARVASLTAEAAQWQAAASGVAAKYTGIMQSMRAAYVQKETEFDLLMDAKISLAQDLKTYTMLLELEEERLGIKAPARAQSTTSSTEPLVLTPQPSRSSKKRKTTASLVIHSATTSTSSFASDTVDGTQSLIWSHVDLDGRFARLRNCSTQSVSLAGWYVTNADQSQKFDFPDREIPSGRIQQDNVQIAFFNSHIICVLNRRVLHVVVRHSSRASRAVAPV